MSARRQDRLLNSFCSILRLEQAKGFTNKAVINGLDAFIDKWRSQLSAHIFSTADVDKLFHRPYSRMSPAQRAQWVETCLALLDSPAARLREDPPSVIPAKAGIHLPSTVPHKRSPAPKLPPPKPPPPPDPEALHNPVTNLRGVDTKTAEKLARLDVHTVRDLLYHFPRYHKDFSRRTKIADLKIGQDATVSAAVGEASRVRLGKKWQTRHSGLSL